MRPCRAVLLTLVALASACAPKARPPAQPTLPPQRHIRQVRALIATPSPTLDIFLDITDALSSTPAGFSRGGVSDGETLAIARIARNHLPWAATLRGLMPVEAHYFLGLSALSGRSQPGTPLQPPDLEGADAFFHRAYAWREDWPALTLSIANVAMTAEDFDQAVEFFDTTLALTPNHIDAMMGTIRALTYQGRHVEAIAAVERLLATNRNPGEARYWQSLAVRTGPPFRRKARRRRTTQRSRPRASRSSCSALTCILQPPTCGCELYW